MDFLKSFLGNSSKKLVAFLLYVVVLLLNRKFEIGMSETDIYALTGVTGAYTLGQGLADLGKSRAIEETKRALLSR